MGRRHRGDVSSRLHVGRVLRFRDERSAPQADRGRLVTGLERGIGGEGACWGSSWSRRSKFGGDMRNDPCESPNGLDVESQDVLSRKRET